MNVPSAMRDRLKGVRVSGGIGALAEKRGPRPLVFEVGYSIFLASSGSMIGMPSRIG
jgi:hypothetical protein